MKKKNSRAKNAYFRNKYKIAYKNSLKVVQGSKVSSTNEKTFSEGLSIELEEKISSQPESEQTNIKSQHENKSFQTYLSKTLKHKIEKMKTKIDLLPSSERFLMSSNEFENYLPNDSPQPNSDEILVKLLCEKSEFNLASPSHSYISLDCEMVEIVGHKSSLARISIVDYYGTTLYDSFVTPPDEVTDYRTWISGITPENLLGAPPFAEVQKIVKSIINRKIVIAHTPRSDFNALDIGKKTVQVIDISKSHKWAGVGDKGAISLKNLTYNFLGIKIQNTSHSSVTDALATMAIFRKLCHCAPEPHYN